MEATNQRKTAKLAGISEGYYSRILSGDRRPSPEVAERLSKLSSTPIKIWLFNTKKNIKKRQRAFKQFEAAV